MLNRSASLAMSTGVLKALPGKLDIKRHSPSILFVLCLMPNKIMYVMLFRCVQTGENRRRLHQSRTVICLPVIQQLRILPRNIPRHGTSNTGKVTKSGIYSIIFKVSMKP